MSLWQALGSFPTRPLTRPSGEHLSSVHPSPIRMIFTHIFCIFGWIGGACGQILVAPTPWPSPPRQGPVSARGN